MEPDKKEDRPNTIGKSRDSLRPRSVIQLGQKQSILLEEKTMIHNKGVDYEVDKGDITETSGSLRSVMPEKGAHAFNPVVTVMNTDIRPDRPEKGLVEGEQPTEMPPLYDALHNTTEHAHPHHWASEHPQLKGCGDSVRMGVSMAAAAVIFPLLLWAGYELLPFQGPSITSTPFRLMYALRCAFFATIPIGLGVLVQSVSRLRCRTLTPQFESCWENRVVAMHWYYVHDSLTLYLLYFLQLGVMATYIQQDLLKLVPLLTVVFVFGRLIYWVCAAFSSGIRGLGYGLSFFPVLAMFGANIYFIATSMGAETLFNTAPPTTAPPPKLRWWW
ncbi:transmembrane protein 79 isoform X2 [Sardina pilchardus]|uniref:transmembrane protein 79 isoform X2 n=1 Tax=Sardina pilchardus TaxID=27697 RepID=UPI002E13541D